MIARHRRPSARCVGLCASVYIPKGKKLYGLSYEKEVAKTQKSQRQFEEKRQASQYLIQVGRSVCARTKCTHTHVRARARVHARTHTHTHTHTHTRTHTHF